MLTLMILTQGCVDERMGGHQVIPHTTDTWSLIWPRKFYLCLWSVPHLPLPHSAPCQTLINLPIKQSLPLHPLLAITDLAGTLNINSISISQFIMSRHGWTQALFVWKEHHESSYLCWMAEVGEMMKTPNFHFLWLLTILLKFNFYLLSQIF